ncbi:MAG: hypothetical protein QS748_08375, partial [Candidatus Endonucleobacter bathymodioli]|nr:hypothetical protein [Candidatus Endonucleobacter bathymodioli]
QWRYLPSRKGKRYRKHHGDEAGSSFILGLVRGSEKKVVHWEGNTVHVQNGYLVTLIGRVSKLLFTVRVKNKTKKSSVPGHQKDATSLQK